MYFLRHLTRAQLRGYSSVQEMTEDNNLQGQGFVLQVQRTAHIEKWTKCYSKNLFSLFYQYIYIYLYTRMYLYIYSFFFFFRSVRVSVCVAIYMYI